MFSVSIWEDFKIRKTQPSSFGEFLEAGKSVLGPGSPEGGSCRSSGNRSVSPGILGEPGSWGCAWESSGSSPPPGFPSSGGGVRECAHVSVSRGRGRGAGRLGGRRCHLINSGAKYLGSHPGLPFSPLQVAQERLSRGAAEEPPVHRSLTCKILASPRPPFTIWSFFVLPYLILGIFFPFLFSLLNYPAKIY